MNVSATLFVVDPDVSSRQHITAIADEIGMPCEEFENGEGFLAAYKEGRRGCLVTEFRLPGMSGLKLLEMLADKCPSVVVTRFADVRLTVRAMQRGALTVLAKPVIDHDLSAAVRMAVDRTKQLQFASQANQKLRGRFATLSRREQDILPLLLTAMSNEEIATQLDVSKRSVKDLRRSVYRKTRADNVAVLMQLASLADLGVERLPPGPASLGRDLSSQLQQCLDQLQRVLDQTAWSSSRGVAARISHEISQPLQVISNYSAIIASTLQQPRSLNLDKFREWNDMIGRAAELAAEIMQRFCELSVGPNLNRSEESLDEIVRESIRMLNCMAHAKHVKIRFEPIEVRIRVDRVEMQQVMINLLKNAVESAVENPIDDRIVEVKISSELQRAEIVVSDNGGGIAQEQAADLFGPFVTTKTHGLGLGLAISKDIVETHGGRIWHEPNDPKGTSFHVRLPLPE